MQSASKKKKKMKQKQEFELHLQQKRTEIFTLLLYQENCYRH